MFVEAPHAETGLSRCARRPASSGWMMACALSFLLHLRQPSPSIGAASLSSLTNDQDARSSGPASFQITMRSRCLRQRVGLLDLNLDGAVDDGDLIVFQDCMGGADQPPRCAP